MATKRDVTSSVVELELTDVSNALTLRGMLWDMQKDWDKQHDLWKSNPFDQLNVDNLQNSVSHFTQTLYMLEKGSLVPPMLSYHFTLCKASGILQLVYVSFHVGRYFL